MPKPWPGVRAHPSETSAVLMRQVLNCKMSPRLRAVLEAALEHDGDLSKGAEAVHISQTALRKELAALRGVLLEVGLAKRV